MFVAAGDERFSSCFVRSWRSLKKALALTFTLPLGLDLALASGPAFLFAKPGILTARRIADEVIYSTRGERM
jgi:hypothetical protein